MSKAITDKEIAFFFHVLRHMEFNGKLPPTDWDAVAKSMEFKSAAVAKTRYGQIRKKLNGFTEDGTVNEEPAETPAVLKPNSGDYKVKKRVGRPRKHPLADVRVKGGCAPSKLKGKRPIDDDDGGATPKVKAEPGLEDPDMDDISHL